MSCKTGKCAQMSRNGSGYSKCSDTESSNELTARMNAMIAERNSQDIKIAGYKTVKISDSPMSTTVSETMRQIPEFKK